MITPEQELITAAPRFKPPGDRTSGTWRYSGPARALLRHIAMFWKPGTPGMPSKRQHVEHAAELALADVAVQLADEAGEVEPVARTRRLVEPEHELIAAAPCFPRTLTFSTRRPVRPAVERRGKMVSPDIATDEALLGALNGYASLVRGAEHPRGPS